MKETPKGPFTIVIECCQQCTHHSWCSRHDQAKYDTHYSQLKKKIETEIPGTVVLKNQLPVSYKKLHQRFKDDNRYLNQNTGNIVQYPRLGSFEVYADGYLLFSKIQSNLWPSHTRIMTLIQAMGEDRSNGKNISRFSLQNRINHESDQVFKITYDRMIEKEMGRSLGSKKYHLLSKSLQRFHPQEQRGRVTLTPQIKRVKVLKHQEDIDIKNKEIISQSMASSQRAKSPDNTKKPNRKLIRPIQKHQKQYEMLKSRRVEEQNRSKNDQKKYAVRVLKKVGDYKSIEHQEIEKGKGERISKDPIRESKNNSNMSKQEVKSSHVEGDVDGDYQQLYNEDGLQRRSKSVERSETGDQHGLDESQQKSMAGSREERVEYLGEAIQKEQTENVRVEQMVVEDFQDSGDKEEVVDEYQIEEDMRRQEELREKAHMETLRLEKKRAEQQNRKKQIERELVLEQERQREAQIEAQRKRMEEINREKELERKRVAQEEEVKRQQYEQEQMRKVEQQRLEEEHLRVLKRQEEEKQRELQQSRIEEEQRQRVQRQRQMEYMERVEQMEREQQKQQEQVQEEEENRLKQEQEQNERVKQIEIELREKETIDQLEKGCEGKDQVAREERKEVEVEKLETSKEADNRSDERPKEEGVLNELDEQKLEIPQSKEVEPMTVQKQEQEGCVEQKVLSGKDVVGQKERILEQVGDRSTKLVEDQEVIREDKPSTTDDKPQSEPPKLQPQRIIHSDPKDKEDALPTDDNHPVEQHKAAEDQTIAKQCPLAKESDERKQGKDETKEEEDYPTINWQSKFTDGDYRMTNDQGIEFEQRSPQEDDYQPIVFDYHEQPGISQQKQAKQNSNVSSNLHSSSKSSKPEPIQTSHVKHPSSELKQREEVKIQKDGVMEGEMEQKMELEAERPKEAGNESENGLEQSGDKAGGSKGVVLHEDPQTHQQADGESPTKAEEHPTLSDQDADQNKEQEQGQQAQEKEQTQENQLEDEQDQRQEQMVCESEERLRKQKEQEINSLTYIQPPIPPVGLSNHQSPISSKAELGQQVGQMKENNQDNPAQDSSREKIGTHQADVLDVDERGQNGSGEIVDRKQERQNTNLSIQPPIPQIGLQNPHVFEEQEKPTQENKHQESGIVETEENKVLETEQLNVNQQKIGQKQIVKEKSEQADQNGQEAIASKVQIIQEKPSSATKQQKFQRSDQREGTTNSIQPPIPPIGLSNTSCNKPYSPQNDRQNFKARKQSVGENQKGIHQSTKQDRKDITKTNSRPPKQPPSQTVNTPQVFQRRQEREGTNKSIQPPIPPINLSQATCPQSKTVIKHQQKPPKQTVYVNHKVQIEEIKTKDDKQNVKMGVNQKAPKRVEMATKERDGEFESRKSINPPIPAIRDTKLAG